MACSQILASVARLGVAEDSRFEHVPFLQGKGFELHLKDKMLFSEKEIPSYEYRVVSNDADIGIVIALMEGDPLKLKDISSICIDLDSKFYQQELLLQIINAMIPFFTDHNITTVLLSAGYENAELEKAYTELNASPFDAIEGSGKEKIKRFLLDIN